MKKTKVKYGYDLFTKKELASYFESMKDALNSHLEEHEKRLQTPHWVGSYMSEPKQECKYCNEPILPKDGCCTLCGTFIGEPKQECKVCYGKLTTTPKGFGLVQCPVCHPLPTNTKEEGKKEMIERIRRVLKEGMEGLPHEEIIKENIDMVLDEISRYYKV